MARVLITGSTDGLGRAAARKLIEEGHQVILHARSHERVSVLDDLASRSGGVVVGDLRSAAETRRLAEQVNAMGRMHAVIHNAGISSTKDRSPTPEGHASILAVNTLAPYMLTALMERPRRLVFLSSSMHRGGSSSLRDIDWCARRWNASQAYSNSKLYLTTLAFAIARRWPDVLSNAVDPGWVPTKMGGPGAPDDLEQGHLTQSWLAVSDDSAATVSGRYWHHRRPQTPAKDVSDPRFQDQLSASACGVDWRIGLLECVRQLRRSRFAACAQIKPLSALSEWVQKPAGDEVSASVAQVLRMNETVTS